MLGSPKPSPRRVAAKQASQGTRGRTRACGNSRRPRLHHERRPKQWHLRRQGAGLRLRSEDQRGLPPEDHPLAYDALVTQPAVAIPQTLPEALYHASGEEKRPGPGYWLTNARSSALIEYW